jgi:hypothetical protein
LPCSCVCIERINLILLADKNTEVICNFIGVSEQEVKLDGPEHKRGCLAAFQGKYKGAKNEYQKSMRVMRLCLWGVQTRLDYPASTYAPHSTFW